MLQSGDLKVAEGELSGLRFVRLYLTKAEQQDHLTSAVSSAEYVFAYSLADLGEVDGYQREVKATQLIRLDGTEDEVFAGLNKNNRYKVRRSFRDEDIEVVVDDPSRDSALSFYQDVKRADGVIPDIEEDFDSVLWINAYQTGSILSSTCWFDSGEVLRAKHIISTRKAEEADSALIGRLTRRLFWEACVYGLEHGHDFVDLGGVDIATEAKSGVADFKRSFGGDTVDVFVYRHATDSWEEMAAGLDDRVVV